MNIILEKFARDWLKENLGIVEPEQAHIFKKMYSSQDTELDINTVVENMSVDKLDWAMQQVDRTVNREVERAVKFFGAPPESCSCHINAPCGICTSIAGAST